MRVIVSAALVALATTAGAQGSAPKAATASAPKAATVSAPKAATKAPSAAGVTKRPVTAPGLPPLPTIQPMPPARALQADALPPTLPRAEVLSCGAALSRALARNPQARIAAEEIARANAIVEQVRAASLPALTANATYTGLDADRVANGNVILPQNQVNANLFLEVPIVAPSRWVQWEHAKENVDIARMSAADVQRQLALATARTYLSILAQHRVIDVSERAVENARAHYQFAHQRYAGGYGTRVDEVRAAQEVATDEAQLQSNVAQLARLREALGVLLGVDAAIDVTDDVTLPAPPAADESLHDAMTLRADIRLSRQRLSTARRVWHDSYADYLPSLVGTFEPFFQYPKTLTLPEWGFQGTIGLSWSIFDGGLRYGLTRERSALAHEAELTLEGNERQAKSEVRAADEEVRRSAAALAAARDAAKLAADAVTLTNLAYRAGASTNIEVIDAERQARDADTAVAAAEDAWRQATLDLLLASGRFPRPR